MISNDRPKTATLGGSVLGNTNNNATLWQHPYVDVFKHFKIQPTSDWKANKKQGDVSEIFVYKSFFKLKLLGQGNRQESFEYSRKYLSQ